MRLRTQLSLAFFLLAVLPLAAMTLYSYASSQAAYRQAVQAESRRLAEEMGSRLATALDLLSAQLERARTRAHGGEDSPYAKARRDALQAAEQSELRSLLKLVVSEAGRDDQGIPFAIDAEGRLYAASDAAQATLQGLGLSPVAPAHAAAAVDPDDWVVVSQRQDTSGITVGVARPLDSALQQIRRTAARNLAYGLGVVALALFGILPLSRRLTRHLATLTDGVERLGQGDLDVRVPVPHGLELRRLASTFNRMAGDLKQNQERLLEQERLRKELEIGRRIQGELLPREPARFDFAEVAGASFPAREVGGDFFNYFALSEERAAALIGDVSGKGVPAAIMMASLQATLRARLGVDSDLARLAADLDAELGATGPRRAYLTLFIAVVDRRGRRLRYVNAGHGTQFLLRAGGRLERLESSGRPLGLLPGGDYEERTLPVERGDTLLLFTDGLIEAEDAAGEEFGVERLERLAAEAAAQDSAADLLARVEAALRAHLGGLEARDDATLVALKLFDGDD